MSEGPTTVSAAAALEEAQSQRMVPPGERILATREQVLELFTAVFTTNPDAVLMIENWQEWVHLKDGSLDMAWMYRVTNSGVLHGYTAPELLLDGALPRWPQPGEAGYPDGNANMPERRRLGRLLGLHEVRRPDGSMVAVDADPDAETEGEDPGVLEATWSEVGEPPVAPDGWGRASDDMIVLPLPVVYEGLPTPVSTVPEQATSLPPAWPARDPDDFVP